MMDDQNQPRSTGKPMNDAVDRTSSRSCSVGGKKRTVKAIRRVKTGCRTCKLRKLKCDEARPVCKRCSSCGLVCQGYGIWGGGNATTNSSRPLAMTPSSLILPATVTGADSSERDLLNWFRYRTVAKFQSIFGFQFWGFLALRASLEEPAVFHAIIAASAMHKLLSSRDDPQGHPEPAASQKLMNIYERQRAQAVSKLLEPQKSGMTKKATQTALIASLVFTKMDFVMGRYSSGKAHFHSGIKLLSSLRPGLPANPASLGSVVHDANSDFDEACLIEAFCYGNLWATQVGICYWIPQPVPDNFDKPTPLRFESTTEAKQNLEMILSDTVKLKEHARQGTVFTGMDEFETPRRLEIMRNQLEQRVHKWRDVWELSLPSLRLTLQDCHPIICTHSLLMFHEMTAISVKTCITPRDTMAFDAFKNRFRSIIAHGQEVLRVFRGLTDKNGNLSDSHHDALTIVPDEAWHASLFFLASNCRVRRLRLHAVKLLQALPAQDFMWNHKVGAKVANDIVALEHGYGFDSAEDDFDIMELPSAEDLPDPDVPAFKRVYDVRLSLVDDPARLLVTCARDDASGETKSITRQYNMGYQGDDTGAQDPAYDLGKGLPMRMPLRGH